MKLLVAMCALAALSGNLALAQEPTKSGYPVVRMSARAMSKLPPALTYSLLPDPSELKPGNAALVWLRASRLVTHLKPPFDKEKWEWSDKDWMDLPMSDLNRKKIREVLERYRVVLELADIAAHRSECDWDLPPLSIQDTVDVILLSEVQSLRELANLLKLKVRIEVAEHQYDKAVHTLQIGFALARHVGEGPSLIHVLVGIAVGAVMAGRVQDFIEQPDAPSLFWALTMLPRPLIDLRKPMIAEFARLGRAFPFLAGASKANLTEADVQTILTEGIKNFVPEAGMQGTLAAAGLAGSIYPEAKRALLAQGRDAKQVEAMSPALVVADYLANQFAAMRDDILEWMFVPYWQGHNRIEEAIKRHGLQKKDRNIGTILFGLLAPGVGKSYSAWARIDLQIAGLRCAEAIRLSAATHGGKLPKTLGELTDLPLPIDPITGQSMQGWYRLEADGTGVLEVPPPPETPIPLLGRRYELRPAKD
jgi:hypothetical protein